MKYTITNKEVMNTNDWVENVLKLRGLSLETLENINEKNLQSPFDLENIEEGVELLNKHLNGRIAILADCDMDGVSASAIITQYIYKINEKAKTTTFIHEGKQHGLEDQMRNFLDSDDCFDLLIITDAGTNDYKYIEQLKEINLPVLIIDHHELEPTNPISDNCVLINNQTSPNYKNKGLSGGGVTFQFCRACDLTYNFNFATEFTDLAALSIVGDMMDMCELENQYIVQEGFSNINNSLFKALIEKQSFSMKGKVNPLSVAFYIVPLINALIRVGTQEDKETLYQAFVTPDLLTISQKRGEKGEKTAIKNEAIRFCVNAKAKQDKTKVRVAEYLEMKIEKENLLDNKVLFIQLNNEESELLPSTLTGLVAMQVAAKYKRPTLIGRRNSNGTVAGSARGLSNCELISLKDFLSESGLFTYTSGHALAFGHAIYEHKIDSFHEYANEKLKHMNFEESTHEVDIVCNGSSSGLANNIYKTSILEKYWGQNNSEPVFLVKNIEINKSNIQIIGAKKDTLKFVFNNIVYIKFKATELIEELSKVDGKLSITVVGRGNVNEWNGKVDPQLLVEDIEIKRCSSDFDF